jgi:hypothetical protein
MKSVMFNIMANKRHHLSWSPLIGIAVMGIGGVVIWVSPRKNNLVEA